MQKIQPFARFRLPITFLTTVALACSSAHKTPNTRPNILILMADDWNWPHAEEVSDSNLKTPTFERIAREGIRFRNAFVSSPSCTPSRASLLTGLHPWQLETGVHLWGALPAKFQTYTDLLEAAGYLVGYSGKGWGPGYLEDSERSYNPAGKIVVGPEPGRPWDSSDRVETFEEFLSRRESNQPFHFWFNTSDPHRPYESMSGINQGMKLEDVIVPPTLPDTQATRIDLTDYYYEVERFDSEAGKLIHHLEDTGELENTIVVMTGDNGMPFPRAKITLYDLGTKVPLVIRWPPRIQKGRVVDDFVTLSDLAPTLLEAANLKPIEQMSATSFLNTLEATENGLINDARTRVFTGIELHCGRFPIRSIRTTEYLYVRNFEPDRSVALCRDYWESDSGHSPTWLSVKLLPKNSKMYQRIAGQRAREELYDIRRDKYQLNNLALEPEFESIRTDLWLELQTKLQETKDPRIEGNHEEIFYIPHAINEQNRNN